MTEKAIVLFDGDCHFCNSSVQFILKRDSGAFFQFASLQSTIGQRLLQQYGLPAELDSLVVIQGNRAYCKSAAVLYICRHLDGAWKLFAMTGIIPRIIRDRIYGVIASKRYQWFGKVQQCMLPSAEQKERFLS